MKTTPLNSNHNTEPVQLKHTLYHPHERVVAVTGDHSMSIQSAKAECDINNILSQYRRTGIVTHVSANRPTYSDLPSGLDYQQAMNTLIEAQGAFAGLPAKVRDHFANDPARLLVALADPEQADKLREFGILNPLPSAAPAPPASEPTS